MSHKGLGGLSIPKILLRLGLVARGQQRERESPAQRCDTLHTTATLQEELFGDVATARSCTAGLWRGGFEPLSFWLGRL